MEWSTGQSMNCVFVGYISSTITQLDIKIYDAGGLVETLSDVDISDGVGAYYFSTTQTGITSLELVINGPGVMYIGGCEPGVYYQMPFFLADREGEKIDNSIISSSSWGQAQQTRVPWLDGITLPFITSRSVYDEVISQLSAVGTGGTLWVDFFEDDHSVKAPGYYRLNELSPYEKTEAKRYLGESWTHNWSMNLLEAR
ncbi:MAG: hypothetical protein PVJ39_04815 [Gammaproteobacteria bacterium]|jgi:hypothetical protein